MKNKWWVLEWKIIYANKFSFCSINLDKINICLTTFVVNNSLQKSYVYNQT